MASDELKIVSEDVKEKFDTVIEGINMVRGPWNVTKRRTKGSMRNLRRRY